MPENITVEKLHGEVQQLAGYVLDVAKAVYKDHDMEYPEDENDVNKDQMAPEGMPRGFEDEEDASQYPDVGPSTKGMAYKNDEDMMPYMDEEEDQYLARMSKRYKSTKARVVKGYDATAVIGDDEHDSPFDEKDANVDGNEVQPSGEMSGDSEDETFGPGGLSYRATGGSSASKALVSQVTGLKKTVENLVAIAGGQVISKGVIPAGSGEQRTGEPVATGTLTRDMQKEALGKSFKELNRLRVQVGDLPDRLF